MRQLATSRLGPFNTMKARLLTGLSKCTKIVSRLEFGWKVAVDLKANADFNECWSCPGHTSVLICVAPMFIGHF